MHDRGSGTALTSSQHREHGAKTAGRRDALTTRRPFILVPKPIKPTKVASKCKACAATVTAVPTLPQYKRGDASSDQMDLSEPP
jgi:hypothetical protein